MATYTELYDFSSTGLDKKIVTAIAVKANVIAKSASPTEAKKKFAVEALGNPVGFLPSIRNYILAEYNTSTTAIITAATDAQVQAAVDAAVDTLLGV